jgi:HEAT repeat protein
MSRLLGRLFAVLLPVFMLPGTVLTGGEAEPEPRSIEQLIADIEDTAPAKRVQAIGNLANRGEAARPAISAVITALEDPDPEVRMVAALCLGELRLEPEQVMPALEKAIDDPTVDEARPMYVVAGLALGSFGAPALPHLRRSLASDKLALRRGALLGLFRVGPPAAEAIDELVLIVEKGDPQLRGYVHQAIMGIGPGAEAAVEALITNLSSEDFHTQYWACRALGAIGPAAQPATDKLVELVRTGVSSVRHNAATALGDIGPTVGPEAVQALTDAFADYSQIVRNKAVIALGKLQPLSLSAAPTIEKLLREPAQFSPRANAARVLHSMRPETEELVVTALLEDLIADDDPDPAAQFLAEIDFDCDIVQRVIPLLQHERRDTRQYAAIALGNMGPAASDAEAELTKLLKDEAPEVREEAQAALAKIRAPSADN